MKSFLLATTAVVFCGSVFAADLSARMPAKAQSSALAFASAPLSWTGCYVGAHAGAAWGHTKFSDPGVNGFTTIAGPGQGPIDLDQSADFLGGAQVGCDYQFASNWVIGLAGDFSWANIDGHADDPFFAGKGGDPITLHAKTNYIADVTGRFGYAWDNFLLYGKGGAAWAHNRYAVDNLAFVGGAFCTRPGGGFVPVPCNPTGSETRAGWTLGGGVEWAFARNWSALLEFDYYNFGNKGIAFTDVTAVGRPTTTINIRQNVEVVKVGLNYRFGPLR